MAAYSIPRGREVKFDAEFQITAQFSIPFLVAAFRYLALPRSLEIGIKLNADLCFRATKIPDRIKILS